MSKGLKIIAKLVALFLTVIFMFLNFILPVIQAFNTRNAIISFSDQPLPKERSFVMANSIFDSFPDFEKRACKYYQLNNPNRWWQDTKAALDYDLWINTRNIRALAVVSYIALNNFKNFVPNSTKELDFYSAALKEVTIQEFKVENNSLLRTAVALEKEQLDSVEVVRVRLSPLTPQQTSNLLERVQKELPKKQHEDLKACFRMFSYEVYKSVFTDFKGQDRSRQILTTSANVDEVAVQEMIGKKNLRPHIDNSATIAASLLEVQKVTNKETQLLVNSNVLIKLFITKCHDQSQQRDEPISFAANNDFVNVKLNEALHALPVAEGIIDQSNMVDLYVLKEEVGTLTGDRVLLSAHHEEQKGMTFSRVAGIDKTIQNKTQGYVCLDGKVYIADMTPMHASEIADEAVQEQVLTYLAKKRFDYKSLFKDGLVNSDSYEFTHFGFWGSLASALNFDEEFLVNVMFITNVLNERTIVLPSFKGDRVIVLRIKNVNSNQPYYYEKLKNFISTELSTPFTEKQGDTIKQPRMIVN